MFKLLLLLLSANAFAIGGSQRTKSSNDINGLATAPNMVVNPGFELGTTSWTASGGTFSAQPTNPYRGINMGLWDSNGAAQTLTSTAVTIPQWLLGKNAVIGCFIKVTSGAATHTMQAFDGTNNVASGSIISSTSTFALTAINFVAPTSGTLAVRLTSVAADEPEISIDNCFISDASLVNISQVNQATKFASAEFGTDCSWTNSTATPSDFGADASCTSTFEGGAIVGATLPGITLTNVPPGEYFATVIADFSRTNAATDVCNFRLWDGTSSWGHGVAGSYNGDARVHSPGFNGTMKYTTTQASVVLKVQGSTPNATPCWMGYDGLSPATVSKIVVYRFPLSSETAYRPELQNAYGGAKLAATSDCFWNKAANNWDDFAADSDCATPTAIGVGTSSVKTPSATFATVPAGDYLAYAFGNFTAEQSTSGSQDCRFRISDGIVDGGIQRMANGVNVGNVETAVIMGQFKWNSVQTNKTLRVQINRFSGNGNCSLYANNADFVIVLVPQTQNIPAPILVGGVSTNFSGNLRQSWVLVTGACNTSPCTIAQSSGDITNVTRSSQGRYSINFSVPYAANVMCKPFAQSTSAIKDAIFVSRSTTAYAFDIYNRTPSLQDDGFEVFCWGPR